MRRLRRYALAVPLLILATACDEPIPGAKRTLTAAEAAPPEAALVPEAATTTAVSPPATPPTTSASVVAPTTTVRRATSTVVGAAPRTPPPPPPPPPLPGQVVSPATMLAVTTTATEGTTTANLKAVREQHLGEKVLVEVTVSSMELITSIRLELELLVYPREQYLGERVQVGAQVSKPDSVAITSVKIDFGNGHVVTGSPGPGWYCGPSTYHAGASASGYVYPAPGTYKVTATFTFVACMGVPGMWIGPYFPPPAGLVGPWFPEPHQAVTASMGMLQRPDRHPPPVGPPPGP